MTGAIIIKKSYVFFFLIVILLVAIAHDFSVMNPVNSLRDGYYTAEEAEYYHGWKEYITIYVNNGRIVTADFDGRNGSGFIKSWDMDYMRIMNKTDGTYPNKYVRAYVSELVERQTTEGIDAVSGATESYLSFRQLADAAILQAGTGEGKVAFVNINREEQ